MTRPLDGITVEPSGTRDCRAVLHPATGRPGRARHQGRAPRRGGLCPRLRPARARRGFALRLGQPLQGEPGRHLKQPGAVAVLKERIPLSADALVHPGPGRRRPHGPGLRGAEGQPPAAHRLRHLRLRRRRPLPRQKSLRLADPERGGVFIGHGHASTSPARRATRWPTLRRACTPTAASWRRCCSAQTGQGSHIDVSMLESLGEWMGYPMYYAFEGARAAAAHGGHRTPLSTPMARLPWAMAAR